MRRSGPALLVAIDTESDNQWSADARRHPTFRNTRELERLHGFFVRYGVRPTYVVTYPVVRDVGMPPVVPPSRWKPGYVYSTVTELMKRPGRERFVGGFRGAAAPRPVDCSPEQTLLVLE